MGGDEDQWLHSQVQEYVKNGKAFRYGEGITSTRASKLAPFA